ncbi:hypothetical protein [Actinomycetospora sp.]|jgi:hypothetical protein|uniref:hypothetical protein n=1 Tax=Actinomycetospora sp. TaxID=1872135 RepID=UPI002F42AC3F
MTPGIAIGLHVRTLTTAAVLALAATVFSVGGGTASASAFCSGSGLALPQERNHQINAGTSTFGSPGYQQTYKLTDAGPAAVTIAVRGYDAAKKETWTGVPLSAGGSGVPVTVPWGYVSAPPAIRVTNLDPVRGASVSFTCNA